MLHLSPCIFIASFNEISCLIVFLVFRLTLALASYNFVFKIPKRDCFKCKSWRAAHLKCFCSSWLLQIQNQQAALWNYLAPCKWTSAIATLPPTRFCENHWHAVSTCKWLHELQSYASISIKSLPCEWLLRFDFFGGVSGDIAQTKSHVNLAPCKWSTRFEKEKRQNVDSRS